MKVILRQDVDQVGRRGDLVDVADGHARNYLIPQGLAMRATAAAEAQADQMRKAAEARDTKAVEAAQEVATALVPTPIHITAKAHQGGTLFGSVSETDVVEAVKAQTDIELDRKAITIEEHIKEAGTHFVMAKLHHEVQFPITIEVTAEETD
ncbi:MAG: 50S ribosomal protein L9 [Acidimicrobiales bacterium]|nr:50S ribosomal protein L9 [Acidimicrobiales bacterium]